MPEHARTGYEVAGKEAIVRLMSRGLGRKELVMDFREYDVIPEGDEVIVIGTIRDPVNWDFSIRMCRDDLPGMARLVFRKPVIGLLIRWLFSRNVKHHWTQQHPEHLAEGKERLSAARQKAEQRRIAYREALAEASALEAAEAKALGAG